MKYVLVCRAPKCFVDFSQTRRQQIHTETNTAREKQDQKKTAKRREQRCSTIPHISRGFESDEYKNVHHRAYNTTRNKREKWILQQKMLNLQRDEKRNEYLKLMSFIRLHRHRTNLKGRQHRARGHRRETQEHPLLRKLPPQLLGLLHGISLLVGDLLGFPWPAMHLDVVEVVNVFTSKADICYRCTDVSAQQKGADRRIYRKMVSGSWRK